VEYDDHGAQVNAYKIMKYLNKDKRDTVEINIITEEDRLKHYKTYDFTQRN
jgi:hypothetical protein